MHWHSIPGMPTLTTTWRWPYRPRASWIWRYRATGWPCSICPAMPRLTAIRAEALARLGQHGVTESRIEFIDKVSRPEYLGLYHRIDLCFDPTPCDGHT